MTQVFLNHIPPAAQEYCRQLAEEYTFRFILKKSRASKLGDFRHDRAKKEYIISVNNDLNPYQFLITFIHELAHLKVALEHHRFIKSHGKEWKMAFIDLSQPVLNSEVFPEPLLSTLKQHMKNPKAAAGSDPKLWQQLKVFDEGKPEEVLNNLPDGALFSFRKKQFKRIEKRRTRILCRELKSKRLYLIPGIADVEELKVKNAPGT